MENVDLNLFVALDALFAEGSVTGASRRLGLSSSAMSRTLARLRSATGDPLLVRIFGHQHRWWISHRDYALFLYAHAPGGPVISILDSARRARACADATRRRTARPCPCTGSRRTGGTSSEGQRAGCRFAGTDLHHSRQQRVR